MKTILNILLLLIAIAWAYYDSHEAHALVYHETVENTQKLVDSDVFEV